MARVGDNNNIMGWLLHPTPGYVPLADVAFAPPNVDVGTALPPSSMRFPNAEANKMNNLPGIQSVYDAKPTGRQF